MKKYNFKIGDEVIYEDKTGTIVAKLKAHDYWVVRLGTKTMAIPEERLLPKE